MMLWLHSPEMARHAQRLGESIRYELALPPRLIALAALTVAVHWNAAYVIAVQSSKSLSEGIAQPAIDAVREGRVPVPGGARRSDHPRHRAHAARSP